MIDSAQVNKTLRRYLGPVLREAGFQKVEPRRAWRWCNASISHVVIRSVGAYFSQVTGWPSQSLVAQLGVHFQAIPLARGRPVTVDKAGRLTPADYECHLRDTLYASIDQSAEKAALANGAERRRTDVWWIRGDGSNVVEVVEDITKALLEKGLPWLNVTSDPMVALRAIESGHDCLVKYWQAQHLAASLGQTELSARYALKYEAELASIGG